MFPAEDVTRNGVVVVISVLLGAQSKLSSFFFSFFSVLEEERKEKVHGKRQGDLVEGIFIRAEQQ